VVVGSKVCVLVLPSSNPGGQPSQDLNPALDAAAPLLPGPPGRNSWLIGKRGSTTRVYLPPSIQRHSYLESSARARDKPEDTLVLDVLCFGFGIFGFHFLGSSYHGYLIGEYIMIYLQAAPRRQELGGRATAKRVQTVSLVKWDRSDGSQRLYCKVRALFSVAQGFGVMV
jgi:hypothetical protein